MKFKLTLSVAQLIVAIGVGTQSYAADTKIVNPATESMNKGILSVYRGNFETAITQLQDAVSADPSNQMAQAYLSYCHNREGARLDSDPILALREFCAALFIDGNNSKARENSKHMIRTLGMNPESAADRAELARQALAAKDYMSAVVEFDASLALKDDPDVKKQLVETLKLAPTKLNAIQPMSINNYIGAIQRKIKTNWKPPRGFEAQWLTVAFETDCVGNVSKLRLLTPSHIKQLNESALDAVELSTPFIPIPPNTVQSANVLFTFAYTGNGFKPTMPPLPGFEKLVGDSEETAMQFDVARWTTARAPEQLAKASLSLATLYENKNRLSEAEQILLKAQSAMDASKPTPELPEVLNRLAEIYVKQGKYDLAEPLLKQSISLSEVNPDLGLFRLTNALTLYGRVMIETNRKDLAADYLSRAENLLHQHQRSIDDYDKLIASEPEVALNYLLRAKLFEKLDLERAKLDLNKAIALNPRYAEAYAIRSSVNETLKNDNEALTDIQKAKELDPGNAYTYRISAQLHGKFMQWPLVVADLSKAIELEPRDGGAFRERGEAYRKLKDYSSAMKDFNQALSIFPAEPVNYASRAQCFMLIGQYDSALKDFETAIKLKPDFAYAYRGVGLVFSDTKDYPRALEAFNKGLTLDPKITLTIINRGYVYAKLGQFEKAAADFTESIKENPNSRAYGNRSWAYYGLKDYAHAKEDAELAIKAEPTQATGYLNRGRANLMLQQLDSALSDLNKSISIQENFLDGKAFYYRAKVYEKLSKPELADADMKKAQFLGLDLSKVNE